MMTFKQFYLQGSKDDKAPLRARRSFKTPQEAGRDLDRIAKLKAAKVVLAAACPKLPANRTYGGRRGNDAIDPNRSFVHF